MQYTVHEVSVANGEMSIRPLAPHPARPMRGDRPDEPRATDPRQSEPVAD